MSWEMLMEEAARNSAWLNERFNLDMNGYVVCRVEMDRLTHFCIIQHRALN